MLFPDTETPFLNAADAVKRLSKYHVLQEAPPEPEQVLYEDEVFQARAEYIRHRRHVMNNKYRRLLLRESMVSGRRARRARSSRCGWRAGRQGQARRGPLGAGPCVAAMSGVAGYYGGPVNVSL